MKNDLDALKRRINQGFSTIVMRKQYDVAEALRKANESLKEQRQSETPTPSASSCSSSCSSSSNSTFSHEYYSECTTCRERGPAKPDEDFGAQNIDLTKTDSDTVINITITGGNVTINL